MIHLISHNKFSHFTVHITPCNTLMTTHTHSSKCDAIKRAKVSSPISNEHHIDQEISLTRGRKSQKCRNSLHGMWNQNRTSLCVHVQS